MPFDISHLLIILILSTLFIFTFYFISKKIKRTFTVTIKEISKTLTNLIGITTQLKNSNSDISQSSTEQASAIQESATASDEIFSMAKSNQDKTDIIASRVTQSFKNVENGRNLILDLDEMMSKINQSSNKLTTQIEASNHKFSEILTILNEINQKTSIIHEIVFQTKLLSFNASVEAARAGEHGKGFAVVAQEIGNLATMSGNSAQEIEKIIVESTRKVTDILKESETNSKNLIDDNLVSIQKGLEKSHDCRKIFDEITSDFKLVSEDIHSVSNATDEQTKGVQEISYALNHLSEITQRNTLISQQTTQSINLLGTMVEEFDGKILNTLKAYDKSYSPNRIDEIIWGEKYHIGVSKMDHEHEILVEKINNLIHSMNDESIKKIGERFKDLAEYVVEHFSDEERFMAEIHYPQLDSHKKIHENLINNMTTFQVSIEHDELDKRKLASFLQNWLITHILGVDMKYGDFYNKN